MADTTYDLVVIRSVSKIPCAETGKLALPRTIGHLCNIYVHDAAHTVVKDISIPYAKVLVATTDDLGNIRCDDEQLLCDTFNKKSSKKYTNHGFEPAPFLDLERDPAGKVYVCGDFVKRATYTVSTAMLNILATTKLATGQSVETLMFNA
jgi:hypothetical protein